MHCLLHSYSQAALAMSASACLIVRIKFPFKGSRVLFYDMLVLHGWGVSCLLRSPDLPGSQCFWSHQWPNTPRAPVCPTAAVFGMHTGKGVFPTASYPLLPVQGQRYHLPESQPPPAMYTVHRTPFRSGWVTLCFQDTFVCFALFCFVLLKGRKKRPRPLAFKPRHHNNLTVKVGITGLWFPHLEQIYSICQTPKHLGS